VHCLGRVDRKHAGLCMQSSWCVKEVVTFKDG